MSKTPDRGVEKLLCGAACSNAAHKEALRKRLLSGMQALELADLALVAGGLSEAFILPDDWPDKETSHA